MGEYIGYYSYYECSCNDSSDSFNSSCECIAREVTQSGIDILFYILIWTLWFITITGNVLTLTVFVRDRQLRSKAANLLILNLSCADLLIGINSLTMTNLMRHFNGYWVFGEVLCKIHFILDYSASTQSAFAITLISADRLILVTTGAQYKKYQTANRAKLWITISWCVSVNLYFIPFLISDHIYGKWVNEYYGAYGMCDFGIVYEKWYKFCLIVVTFGIPLVLLMIFNSIVYHNVRKRALGQTRQHSCKVGTSQNHRSSDFKKHRKAAITLAVIVVAFLICWIPLWIKELVYYFVELGSDFWLFNTNAAAYLSWSNSALNPFIYCATNPRIRLGIATLLCCKSRRPQTHSRY
ncbi:trace amine-associated receptor 7g-like [Amphiura filiformis]|uniref:trace amine-associated receptor 7g-like n=1 Tax=Amphiura filiformis TaxID=82378 RepID=UPI003B21D54B